MSEHLIKALEEQRNTAMNQAAVHMARASQFEQLAKELQAQCDGLNEKLNANSPPAEIVEEAKKAHGHRGRKKKLPNGAASIDPPNEQPALDAPANA